MKVKDLMLRLAELYYKELIDFNDEAYICIIRADCTEEKVKLSSISICDGGYIPNGNEDKNYLIFDGEKWKEMILCKIMK